MEYKKEIAKELLEATKSGDIDWKERKSMFSSDTEHYYAYDSEDGKTTFEVKIKLEKDFKLIPNRSHLMVSNDDLVDDNLYIYPREVADVIQVCEIIYKKKIVPFMNTSKQENVLEGILNSIGTKATRRDKKIDEILSNPFDEYEYPEEEKSESNEKKKEPFWKRFL
jgi:hypothetical protein